MDKLERIMSSLTKITGISAFSKSQAEYISVWVNDWEMSAEDIVSAYNKTIDMLGKVKFNYWDSVLKARYKDRLLNMAKIERTFKCNCKEVTISHNGTSYLVICGKHVNGGYCAFPRLKIATELSGYDGDYGYNEEKLRLVLAGYEEDVTELARIITDTIRKLPDVLPY